MNCKQKQENSTTEHTESRKLKINNRVEKYQNRKHRECREHREKDNFSEMTDLFKNKSVFKLYIILLILVITSKLIKSDIKAIIWLGITFILGILVALPINNSFIKKLPNSSRILFAIILGILLIGLVMFLNKRI